MGEETAATAGSMTAAALGTDKLSEGSGIPREIELKLEIPSGEVEALLDHPLLARAGAATERDELHAVYFDTPDLALRRAGLSLRVRRRNGQYIQTIKAERQTRGLALDRGEWETSVENGEIDFGAAADTPLAPFVEDDEIRAAIRPAFTVRTERRSFDIGYRGATIEISLDDAEI